MLILPGAATMITRHPLDSDFEVRKMYNAFAVYDPATRRYLNLKTGEFDSLYIMVDHLFMYEIYAHIWINLSDEDRPKMLAEQNVVR
jgi:hypothetical protein